MSFAQYVRLRFVQLQQWLKVRRKKLLKAAGLGLGLVGVVALVLVIGAVLNPKTVKNATAIQVSSLAKTTVNGSSEIDPLTADTTLKWTKSVDINDDELAISGSVIEEIDDNQVFVGDIQLPKGWTADYSTMPRGTSKASLNFQTYDMTTQSNNPLSDITYLRINTGAADGVKPYASSPLIRPLESKRIITEGKPGPPILFQNKIYTIIRGVRAPTTSNTLTCFDLITYQTCSGNGTTTFPTYLSSTGASATVPTALGTGSKDISTPFNFQSVMDDGTYGHNGRVFIPGQVGTSYGVVCVDLASLQNCGFSALGTRTAPSGYNPTWLDGFVQSGSRIYGHANDATYANQRVVCFDIRTGAGGGVCSDYVTPRLSSMAVIWASEHANYESNSMHVMHGTRMYWTVQYTYNNTQALENYLFQSQEDASQRKYGTYITCFDVATRASCTGNYTTNPPRFYASAGPFTLDFMSYAGNIYMWEKDGANKGVCITMNHVELNQIYNESLTYCRDLTTAAVLSGPDGTVPIVLPVPSRWQNNTVPAEPAWQANTGVTTIIDNDEHKKTFFPYQYGPNGTAGAVICYDWDIQANCAGGIPKLKYWYNTSDGTGSTQSGDVGYVFDGSCMYGVSRLGFLWSFNSKTGESPCRVAGAKYTASINPAQFYCDGQNHAFEWKSAQVAKASIYDFENYNVKVYDSPGGSLLGLRDIKNSGKLDLTGLSLNGEPFSNYPDLYVEVDSNVWNQSPWSNSNQPYAKVQAEAANVQYCYKTRTKTYNPGENMACDITQLGTVSDATFTSEDNTFTDSKSSNVTYHQPANKQCFKDLKVTVTPDKTLVKNDQTVTYTITVQNKANTDSAGRGNIPSAFNSALARFEATLPSGLEYISASTGGVRTGNKVVWSNQSINAATSKPLTVTLKAPSPVASLPKSAVVYAASEQTVMTMQAEAIYNDDVYPSDNSASNNQLVFEDNAAPSISNLAQTVSSPRAPASLHFTVTATDDNQVAAVELLHDGNVVGTMTPTSTPNQYEITLDDWPAGTSSFTARATDDGDPGLSATSSPLSVVVAPANTAPAISNFNQSSTNLRAPADLNFTVTVTDDYGLGTVELLENSNVVGTMTPTPTPHQFTLAVPDETAGTHSYRVRAKDTDNPQLTSTSSSLSVIVTPLNTVPVVSELSQTTVSPRAPATLNFTVTVTDDYALSTVRLLNGETIVGTMTPTATTDQYALTLSNQLAGSYQFRAEAVDDGSPALVVRSAPLAISVAEPLPPPEESPAPENTAPVISGFAQTVSSPKSPARLTFVATVTDDHGLDKVELLLDGVVKGLMVATATDNQFSLTLDNYSAGTYRFQVRASDTATPALSSQTESLTVEVTPGAIATRSNQDSDWDKPLTPAAIRDAMPSAFSGVVEGAFRTADTIARPVSPTVAKSIPYTTISLLGGFALVYSFLALRQIQTKRYITELTRRFKQTDTNRKGYLDLTSHYLNTPITVMQMSLEMLESKKLLSANLAKSTRSRLTRLTEHANNLLGHTSQITGQSKQAAAVFTEASKSRLIASPGFIVPVVGVLLVAVFSNALFVWARKYDATAVNLFVQSGLYVLGAFGLAASYLFMKREKLATQTLNNELMLEKSISDSQSEFIQSSGGLLAADVAQMDTVAAVIAKQSSGQMFVEGLDTLHKAVDRLSYLHDLTESVDKPAKSSIQIDVLVQQVLKHYDEIAKAKHVSLKTSIEPLLRVVIDSRGFQQLLTSTLDNAIKFTESGGEVMLRITQKTNTTVIHVEDTGVGIPKEKLAKLFSPFLRGSDTRNFDYEGMGIDLYMDKLIVERWGGDIAVDSKPHKGTTVTITLKSDK